MKLATLTKRTLVYFLHPSYSVFLSIYSIVLITSLFLGILPLGCSKSESFPKLKGSYMGQKPPGKVPEIFAPGIVTTNDKNELNAAFSPRGDEFYYAVYNPKPVDTCMIMVSRQENGFWTRPQVAPFSGKGVDVDMAFGPDGNQLYFCSVRGESKHDIWVVDRQKDNTWSEPNKLASLINTLEGETFPTITRTGRMYFSALRPEGLGGKDVYYSDTVAGDHTKPINLGSDVNSPYEEGDTFVAPDESYMIISSAGRPDSLGASDLYVSFKKRDSTWTTPENLGDSINTQMFEYSPMVSPDGLYLFFSRYFDGKSDIFWISASIIEELRSEHAPDLKGPYLGQRPPDTTPEIFAPGIVSKAGSRDLMHGFFDGGKLFILYRYPSGFKGDWTKEPLLLMKSVKGIWTAPYKSREIGKPWFYNLESATEGEHIVFSWTKNLDGSGPPKELYLWDTTRTHEGWTEPVRLRAPVNTGFETWPSLSRDNTLYFFSRRDGGMGKFDIYQSIPDNGEYKQVQNLGEVINTQYIEEDPFIAPDGSYLLFDSNRPGGSGGFDLYISWCKNDRTWTKPVNLGEKINSKHSECRAYVSPDGKYLFFSSDRNGDYDSWWVSTKVLDEFRN